MPRRRKPRLIGNNHFEFSLDSEDRDALVVSGESEVIEQVQEDDRIKTTTRYMSALLGPQRRWIATTVNQGAGYDSVIGDPPVSFSSTDTDVATVDAAGQDHYVGDGTCRIVGTSAPDASGIVCRREKTITNAAQGGQTVEQVVYTPHPGSAREDATSAIDGRIAVAGKLKPIYATQDHDTPLYIRSDDCWAADLDLTCISPWNSTGVNKRAGVLVAPDIVLVAGHYPLSTGGTIRFVDSAGNVITRTISATETLGNAAQFTWPDIQVCRLNADVTECSLAKILPDDWADYLPNGGAGIPVWTTDQEEKALVRDVLEIGHVLGENYFVYTQAPTNTKRLEFYETLIGGDSGSQAFMVVGGELVLLTLFSGPNYGSCIVSHRAEIEAAMATLGSPYTLTPVDLTSFNSY